MGGGADGVAYFGNLETVSKKAVSFLKKQGYVKSMINWGDKFSLWPVHLMTSCCGTEFAAASGPRFDLERLGFLPFGGPRQTNLIVIEGTTTLKMARSVRIVWEQMPAPKWVIAMGACAMDGGIFYDSYNTVPAKDIVPIDIFLAGCPPRPEALARAVVMLQESIVKNRPPAADIQVTAAPATPGPKDVVEAVSK
ncbi:MAG: NADH-quinone oxidoreductase subunit NuoB [Nitrososphaerota archaeon]|nr:NADH-quinone oxidoreductase subunit NuoB [Nitrososphaerota archaeon]MDG7047862.1 NADH-quinone oxidoreductase subunit NuoB [Nitrososphaerota archaeon]MDG7048971.1 NADH-quinone oxidoreductase subunit NuoB [Nitrososphaerota archaeon]MDG7051790.1 NADH-quinone oxidoreductase subunit NuoB [Nitrososphaerota archaeon]